MIKFCLEWISACWYCKLLCVFFVWCVIVTTQPIVSIFCSSLYNTLNTIGYYSLLNFMVNQLYEQVDQGQANYNTMGNCMSDTTVLPDNVFIARSRRSLKTIQFYMASSK